MAITKEVVAEKVESVGGYINAYTSEEVTAYWVKLLASDLKFNADESVQPGYKQDPLSTLAI